MTFQNVRNSVLLFSATLLLAACVAEKEPTKEELTQERAESISQSYYLGEIRSETLMEELTEALKEIKLVDGEEKVKLPEEVDLLLSTYLDGAVVNADKYNKILETLFAEIQLIEKEESIDIVKKEDIDKIPEGTIKGFIQDIEKHHLKLVRNEEKLEVFVDYDAFESDFGKYFSPFQENIIKVQRDIQDKPFYDYESGIIHFENVMNRLTMLDEIQDGDISKDDFYWEGERYFYYASLLGFSDSTMSTDKGVINETALSAMKELVAAHEDNLYVKDLQKVAASLEKEKAYGVETITLANQLINEKFKDYISHVEEKEKTTAEESPETDTATVESAAAEEPTE